MGRYVLILVGVAVLFYVGMEILSRPTDQRTAPIIKGPHYNEIPGRETRGALRTPVVAEVIPPAGEQDFIRAIQQSQLAFQSAPNEMAAGGIRFQRRVAICRILPAMFVSKWVGRVTTLESNSDGKGVLEISLADGISVKTWNNDISDISDHTLIEPSSALFAAVSQRKVGDQGLFSGTFFPGGNVDCVKEASVSLHGSMKEPEFVFRFADVTEPSDRQVMNTSATLPARLDVAPATKDDPESPQSNVVRAAEIANAVSDEHLDEDSAIYKVGGKVSAPKAVFAPDPEYSEEARKAKLQGKCVLWLVVGPDGRAHDIRVAQKLGLGLDEKAIEAVKTWKCEPAMQDGKPVVVQINVEVTFRLYQSPGQIDSGASDDAAYKDWQKRHRYPQ
jgi:TonB family protein